MLPRSGDCQPFRDGSWVSDSGLSIPSPWLLRRGMGAWEPIWGSYCLSLLSFSDPSTRSWPLGGRAEGGEDEEEVESFPQPVDDYFVEPPQAEEEEEEEKERVPPPSSHTPAMVSKGEAVSPALFTI